MDPLQYLFALEPIGIKFGLENIQALVASLGHPERAYRTIHIAGTNGKGSVTAMIDAALRAAGHRSARYTSPHLVDISERFVVDGRPIDRAPLDRAIEEVRRHADRLRAAGTLDVQPTFFEMTTAVAFEIFRHAGVDVAVIEVGLGGRLDATNVVSPEATAITSIALDHEQYLGRTLREIAIEKAGIIKPGVPVVVGPMDPEADAAIAQVARERGAEVVRATIPAGGIRTVLAGEHQIQNAAVAATVLERIGVSREAIVDGFAHVSWPGRLDTRHFPDGREILLDAAHNPAGAAALASYLKARRADARSAKADAPVLVFSAMRDKDIDGVLNALLPHVAALIATRASNPRAADPTEIAARARTIAPDLEIAVEPAPARAIAAAWRRSPRIVVAGSIFLLGDIMRDTLR